MLISSPTLNVRRQRLFLFQRTLQLRSLAADSGFYSNGEEGTRTAGRGYCIRKLTDGLVHVGDQKRNSPLKFGILLSQGFGTTSCWKCRYLD